jgi:uncharacterized membrane protein
MTDGAGRLGEVLMATTQIDSEVRIDRPVSEVFAACIDVPRWGEWQSRFVEVEQSSPGDFGLGTTVRTVSAGLGRKVEARSEVTEFVPDDVILFTGGSEALSFNARWSFERLSDEESRLQVHMESTPREGNVLAKLVHPWITRVFRRRLDADLETLKMMLEGAP